MHTCNIWKLFLVYTLQPPTEVNILYTQYVQPLSYLYLAVSNIPAAATEYITLGYFNSHTFRKKLFGLVINSNNRSDGIS